MPWSSYFCPRRNIFIHNIMSKVFVVQLHQQQLWSAPDTGILFYLSFFFKWDVHLWHFMQFGIYIGKEASGWPRQGRKLRIRLQLHYPADIYMSKVSNKNARTRCETHTNLTIKTPEWRHGVVLMSLLLALYIFHTLF